MHHATRLPLLILVLLIGPAAANVGAQTITGLIRSAQNGNMLPSMVAAAYAPDPTCSTKRVVCWKNIANATTDVAGRYILNVTAGAYRVLAYDPNGAYATQFSGDADSFDVTSLTTVGPAQATTVNFDLKPAATISGIALTGGGSRAGITVAAFNLSGTRRGFTMTAANSTFSFIVPAGTYKLIAYDESGTFASAFFRDRIDFKTADTVTVNAGGSFTGGEFLLPIGARFSGSVTDNSGAPIDGATVLAYDALGNKAGSAYTTTDGTFSMTLRSGTYRFVAGDESRVYAPAFLGGAISFDSSPAISLSGGQTRGDLHFTMQTGGRLQGVVGDGRNGTPLSGLTVAAYNADGTLRDSGTTTTAGAYELLLPPAAYTVAAWDANLVFAPQFHVLSNSYRLATPVMSSPGTVVPLQAFALKQAGRFSGAVTNQNGDPVPGAVVAAYDIEGYAAATSRTNATGQYRIGVNPGSYKVIAYDPELRYAVTYAGGTTFDGAPLRSVSADSDQTVNLTLASAARVSGRVNDSLGRAVSGIEVTAYDPSGARMVSGSTNWDGSFTVPLVPGVYKFGVHDATGRYPAAFFGGSTLATAASVTVTSSGASSITITVSLSARRRAAGH